MYRNQISVAVWGQNIAGLILMSFLSLIVTKRKYANSKSRYQKAVLPALLGLLILTFANQGLEGVHRWISIGIVRINVAMIILPLTLIELWNIFQTKDFWFGCGAALGIVLILFFQPDASQLAGFAIPAMIMSGRKTKSKIVRFSIYCVFSSFVVFSWVFPDNLPPVSYVEKILDMVAGMGVVWLILGAISLAILPTPFLMFPPENAKPISRYIACYYIIVIFSTLLGNFPVPLMGYGVSPIIGYYLSLIWYYNNKNENNIFSPARSDSKVSKRTEEDHRHTREYSFSSKAESSRPLPRSSFTARLWI